jgi:hypothetical protein
MRTKEIESIQCDKLGEGKFTLKNVDGKLLKVVIDMGTAQIGTIVVLKDECEGFLNLATPRAGKIPFYPRVPVFQHEYKPIDGNQMWEPPIVYGNLFFEFKNAGPEARIEGILLVFE